MTKLIARRHDVVRFELHMSEKLGAVQGHSYYFTYHCPNPGHPAFDEWSYLDWVRWIDRRGHWIHKGDYYAQPEPTVSSDSAGEGRHAHPSRDVRS